MTGVTEFSVAGLRKMERYCCQGMDMRWMIGKISFRLQAETAILWD